MKETQGLVAQMVDLVLGAELQYRWKNCGVKIASKSAVSSSDLSAMYIKANPS